MIAKLPESSRFIECRVDNEIYALDMHYVLGIHRSELIRWNSAYSFNHVDSEQDQFIPRDAIGWIRNLDRELPIYALKHLLHSRSELERSNSSQRSGSERVIELEHEFEDHRGVSRKSWSLLVDSVSQVRRFENTERYPIDSLGVPITSGGLTSILRIGEKLMLGLSPAGLFAIANGIPDRHQAPGKDIEVQSSLQSKTVPSRQELDPLETPHFVIDDDQSHLNQSSRIVLFTVPGVQHDKDSLKFGLSLSQVPEILSERPSIPLPGSPEYVVGLIIWRDQPVVLLDMAARFGLGSALSNGSMDGTRIVIVRDCRIDGRSKDETDFQADSSAAVGSPANALLLGIVIESDVKVLELPLAYRRATGKIGVEAGLIRGAVGLQDGNLVIPDLPAMIV